MVDESPAAPHKGDKAFRLDPDQPQCQPPMTENRNAILLMVLAMSALATNDAIIRWGGVGMPVGQIMFLRGVFLCVVLYLGARFAFRQSVTVREMLHTWCLMRGVGEVCATYLFLTSLFLVPIATATTLVFFSPVLLTFASRFVFHERVGPWRWGAVAAGFVGVALITDPSGDDWDPAMLLALGAAGFVALRDVSTRKVASHVSSAAVTMTTSVMAMLGGLLSLLVLPDGWPTATEAQLGWMALSGIIIGVSFFTYILAIRMGEMSLIAPIQYVIILWAALYGWVIWDETPDLQAVLGAAIIVASGLLILWRERVARQRAET